MGALGAQVVAGSVHAAAPCCPRCGYDQSGLVAAWRESCPLRGVCSECGFEFEWARVINAERYRLAWFYEHARGRKPELRRAWRTWQRAIVPWRFWRAESGVRLDSPQNGWRLLAWLPLLVACVWVVGGVFGVANNLVEYFFGPQFPAGSSAGLKLYWLGYTILRAFVAPIGDLRWTTSGWWFNPYMIGETPYVVKAWMACCVVMPLMLLILPRTRGMVKVRAIHVWRAAVYGMALLVLWPLSLLQLVLVQLMPEVNNWLASFQQANQQIFLALQAMWAVLGVGWFGLWWWIVLVRVFALPNGRWVWTLLMIACVLAAGVVAAFCTDFAMLLFG